LKKKCICRKFSYTAPKGRRPKKTRGVRWKKRKSLKKAVSKKLVRGNFRGGGGNWARSSPGKGAGLVVSAAAV